MSVTKTECLAVGQTISGEGFTLPPDAATQKIALMGKSGSGKTYAATRLAELLYGIGVQIVALDPVGVWYGLRLDKSGKGEGLPIPVFGGEYGDIPLEPGAGALVAETIVNRNISVILDVSGFRKGQRKEFVTAFAEELFHRKKAARSPVMLFLEECQAFIPQKTFKGEEKMLGAFEDIGKIGRNYGIGLTMISQRPQAVNKEVLNQAEALFALQMMAAQERKAIRDWIHAQGIDTGAVIDDLPHLRIGEAYVWSPMWLRYFGKIKFSPKETYNASATPTFSSTQAARPRHLKPEDLAALQEAMQEVVKQAEAKDPIALRRRIAQLEQQLRASQAQVTVERVEVPVLKDEQVAELKQSIVGLAEMGQELVKVAQALGTALARVHPEQDRRAMSQPVTQPDPVRPAPPVTSPKPKAAAVKPASPDTKLRAGEERMLETLAKRYPIRVTRPQLGTLAGFTASGGTFGTYLGTLKRGGYIEEVGGEILITQVGLDYLGHTELPTPQTTQELLEMWHKALRAGECRMLDKLVEIYPNSLSREALGEETGFTASGGTFGAYLGVLRRNGLVEVDESGIRASATLFME